MSDVTSVSIYRQLKRIGEIEKLISEASQSAPFISPLNSEPLAPLRKILSRMTVVELRKLALRHGLSSVSRVKKDQLIIELYAAMTSQEEFNSIFLKLSPIERHSFEKLLFVKYLPVEECDAQKMELLLLRNLGYVNYYFYAGEYYAAVSDELKMLHYSLCRSGRLAELARATHFNNYTLAAVNLYGVVKLSDLIGIFNANEYRVTTPEEYLHLINEFFPESQDFYFHKDFIINSYFKSKPSSAEILYSKASSHPRYIPVKQLFLRYADPDFHDRAPSFSRLEWFLIKYLPEDPDYLDLILCKLIKNLKSGMEPGESASVLAGEMPNFPSKELPVLMKYVFDTAEDTRLWENNGHSSVSIRNLRAAVRQVVKLGRNDICFCGSGKKFKKCCGR